MRYEAKTFKASPLVECSCGCGTKFTLYDKEGRKRLYANGHNTRKYDDPTQYKREWNHRNREQRSAYKKEYGHKRKADLLKLKGSKCTVCSLEYDGTNAPVFDFHHRNPKEKKFALSLISLYNKVWESILQEAEKCDVVCSNCHRMIERSSY